MACIWQLLSNKTCTSLETKNEMGKDDNFVPICILFKQFNSF